VIAPKTKSIRALVPSMAHHSAKLFGYPIKHSLTEHFGITLVGPLRYRLRMGFARFTIFVHQEGRSKPIASMDEELPKDDGYSRQSSSCNDDAVLPVEAKRSSKERSQARTTSKEEGGGSQAESEAEAESGGEADIEASLTEAWDKIHTQLEQQVRRGSTGKVCVAAVVGSWRRVEVLQRRLLVPPVAAVHEGPAAHDAASTCSSGIVDDGGNPEEGSSTDVVMEMHEVIMRFTEEDRGQIVQLVVFQSGADVIRRPPSKEAEQTEVAAPALGTAPQPLRWILAEFMVDGTTPLPYDEDEMAKPVPKDEELALLGGPTEEQCAEALRAFRLRGVVAASRGERRCTDAGP